MRTSERARALVDARALADRLDPRCMLIDDITEAAKVLRDLARWVELYGADLDADEKRAQSTFEILNKLGFSGLGLGRERALSQALEWIARNREHAPAQLDRPGQADAGRASSTDSGEGWFEYVTPVGATTRIAYVYESGEIHLPEGGSVEEFRLAAATDRFWKLERVTPSQTSGGER